MSPDNVGAELQQIGKEVTAANMAFEEKGHSGGKAAKKEKDNSEMEKKREADPPIEPAFLWITYEDTRRTCIAYC